MGLSEEANLSIKIGAQDLTGDAFDSASGKMDKFHGVVSKIAGALAGAGTATLVGALGEAARAANDDEANVAHLAQTLENSGTSWDANSAAIEARIKKGQDLAFTDNDIRDSLATLVTSTGDVGKAMDLQGIAMDVARAKHVSLGEASLAVGKAAEGQATSLKRLTGIVDDTGTASDTLALVQQRTAGQAETYGKTTSAAMFKIKDSIDEFKESVGRATGEAQGLISALPEINSGMQIAGGAIGAATTMVKGHEDQMGSLAKTLGKGGVVLGALALVFEAFDQIKQTVDLVRNNWDKFVFALQNGKLDDIPLFGFFFHKAHDVLDLLKQIKSLWDQVSGAFNGGGYQPPPGPADEPGYTPPIIGAASGFSGIVSRPTMFLAGEGGSPERVNIGGSGGGATIIVNVAGSVISENELVDVFNDRILSRLFSQRNLSF